MTYQIRIETSTGEVKKINFTTKGDTVAFIKEYPNYLPKNVRVKLECDLLGIVGFVSGRK